jgi:hypothetical protein
MEEDEEDDLDTSRGTIIKEETGDEVFEISDTERKQKCTEA